MNKKVLSAILFSALFACTGTFTSCIDNDEPEGIENLRGAKAELLRAKVTVEQANAQLILAQAELEKAKAAVQNSIAEQNKALAEHQRLVNERQEITNAEAQADLDAKIAKAELEAQQAQLRHEAYMLTLKESLAEAQRSYELLLAHIEIAKAVSADTDKLTIANLEWAVIGAENAVAAAEGEVETAEENYYNATLDVKRGEVTLKRMETKIANAEATLATAQAEYEKWNGFLAEESETADWTAEISALEDSIKGLQKEQVELEVELAKLKNSEAYKELIDAENGTKYAYDNHKTAEKYETAKIHTTAKKTMAKGAPVDDQEITVGGGTVLVHGALSQIAGPKWDGKGGFINDYANLIAGYTTEKIAVLELINADYETALANAKKASDDATAAWTAAKTAYADAKANAQDVSTAAAETAVETYVEDLETANAMPETTNEEIYKKYAAIVKVKQAFADALVAWYNTLPADQAPLRKLTLVVKKEINGTPKTEYITKTAKEWLSDTDKEIYLDIIIDQLFNKNRNRAAGVDAIPDYEAFYRVGGKREITDAEGNKYETAWSALADKISKTDFIAAKKADLVAKSTAAFGDELLVGETIEEGFMQVVPTDDEVLAVTNYDTACGKLGYYVWMKQESTQYEARNYETIIADYKEAKEYWETVAAALIEENEALYEAYYAAWLAKYTYEVENFNAINQEIYGEIGGRIAALTRVKEALTKAVADYLKVDYADYNGNVAFEAWLKGQVEQALYRVYDAEDALIYAQNMMQQMKDGKIDVWAQLAEAEEALADAMDKLAEKQAELETALANLAKGLEIIAAMNGAE